MAERASMISEWRGARVVVMGLGRFGGGVGVSRWLVSRGANVVVTDLANADELHSPLGELDDLVSAGRITLHLGGHRRADFARADVVIANPAVPKPWGNEFLRCASDKGVPITTEIRLATEHCDRNKVIGVTGTAGKSTTAAMIHHALVGLGHPTHLGGNIGGSLLGCVAGTDETRSASIGTRDVVVLELSSAQLYWLGEGIGFDDAPGWSPRCAVFTNLSPNHLDWHGTFEHYCESKWTIARYQSPDDILLLGDAALEPPASCDPQTIVRPRMGSHHQLALRIPGSHNQQNAATAIGAVQSLLSAEPEDVAATLGDFAGLPHRLQFVNEFGDVRVFNDSKSTTPEATLLAVASFDDPHRVHLIAGGSDKGVDLSSVVGLAPKLAGLYTIGITGRKMAEAAPRSAFVVFCETLDRAVETAANRAHPGDVLLLSPGCASFDQFENYVSRGEAFIRIVSRALHPSEDPIPLPHAPRS